MVVSVRPFLLPVSFFLFSLLLLFMFYYYYFSITVSGDDFLLPLRA